MSKSRCTERSDSASKKSPRDDNDRGLGVCNSLKIRLARQAHWSSPSPHDPRASGKRLSSDLGDILAPNQQDA